MKAKLREGRYAAPCSNEVWAMDFVHDQLATGSKLHILTAIDTYSRFSLAVVPRFSFRALDVIDVLDRSMARLAIQRRSGSTRAASSSPGTSTCGRT